MSLETWKEEFYPIDAEALSESTDIECLEHSMQKWEGFTSFALTKHCLEWKDVESQLYNTCSLCEKYPIQCRQFDDREKICPIVRVTGDSCDCSYDRIRSSHDSPWHFGREGNPKPMIALLARTFDYVLAEDKEEKK